LNLLLVEINKINESLKCAVSDLFGFHLIRRVRHV